MPIVRSVRTSFIAWGRTFWHRDIITAVDRLFLHPWRRALRHDDIIVRIYDQAKCKLEGGS